MKISKAEKLIQRLAKIADRDNDTFTAAYFSREDDKYTGNVVNLDKFDFQIVCDEIKPRLTKGFILPPGLCK